MSNTINILITIDTDRVKSKYSSPSKDQTKPTGIEHDMGYMVATGTRAPPENQGTGDLKIKAVVGDTVRAFATSGSDNFEDAVLLYGLPQTSDHGVFGPFAYQDFRNKSTVVPHSTTTVLPANIVTEDFWFYQASVCDSGTESYAVQFALYTRDANNGQPVLFGYYWWDPTIEAMG